MTTLRLRRPKGQKRAYQLLLLGVIAIAVGFAGMRTLGFGQTSVLIATATIAPGDVLDASNTSAVFVESGEFASAYASRLGAAAFATALVVEGELIPRRAVGKTSLATLDSITLNITSGLASTVREGSLVDVWAAGGSAFSEAKPPRMLATSALVRVISRKESMAKSSVQVELAVNPNYVDSVIAAQAAGDFLAIIGRAAG